MRESITHGGHDWEERVVLSFYRLQRTPRAVAHSDGDRNPEWERAHREFHTSLVAGCGSDWIVRICDRLFDASERYRHWARRAGEIRSTAESEHKAIMEAAIARDAPAATRLLDAHFERTAELVRKTAAAQKARAATKRQARRGKAPA